MKDSRLFAKLPGVFTTPHALAILTGPPYCDPDELLDLIELIRRAHPSQALALDAAPEDSMADVAVTVENHRYLACRFGSYVGHEIRATADTDEWEEAPTVRVPVEWTETELHRGVLNLDATLYAAKAKFGQDEHLQDIIRATGQNLPYSNTPGTSSFYSEVPDHYNIDTAHVLPDSTLDTLPGRARSPEPDEDELDEDELCSECHDPLENSAGEGFDGLCGPCADRAEMAHRWD